MATPIRGLRTGFCALVALLAVFQFSENTADPDLWGHIVFGRQIIHVGAVPKVETFSWTAPGAPWINHEWLAEVMLAAAHWAAGGTGVLLLKMAVGLLTFALCLNIAGRSVMAWLVGALAVVEISYGFAARPQIFTALALAIELALLRRVCNGQKVFALALPLLFFIWVNTHGGVLVGFALLLLTAWFAADRRLFGLIVVESAVALICNPWGIGLLRWLLGSMTWMRPEIQEWHHTPLGWDHAAFFLLIAAGIFAWTCSRRPKAGWEIAAWLMFVAMGFAAARNAPLCAIVTLALIPPHLADALERFRSSFGRWESAAANPNLQKLALALCYLGTLGTAIGTFTLHKEHPMTMEVPRSQYPVAAINFIREHQLHGHLLDFFDWGEEAIFELPDCSVSIDGRLDTCYSRALIAEHWKFYNGEPVNAKVLDTQEADVALLPANLAGTAELAKRPDWRVVYFDHLAAVLIHGPNRFPTLKNLTLPVVGPPEATLGRAQFPNHH